MSEESVTTNGTGGRRRSFRRDAGGATAVEFGLIAIPFIAMMVAIIEIGITYFADNALDSATAEAARLIRTGQAQAQGFDSAAFRDKVCDGVKPVFDCNGLKIDVRTSPDFSTAAIAPPLKPDGTLDETQLGFNAGHGTDIVIVRVFYEWPAMLNFIDQNSTANGKHLLAAVTAFRNEPFNW
ncbi:MAG: pilus assembly protein [Rhizobiales bacterium]|nr:pilus assembly protein [Hyphomicrobiales bacterium]